MTKPRSPLKVFLHHGNDQPDAIRALRSRLEFDGVQVLGDIEPREAIQACDIVLVCLAKGSLQTGGQAQNIKLVSEMAAEKPKGGSSIIPVCLEECDVPDALKRWQAVGVFEETGYEKLMLALKLHADQLGAVLEPAEAWRVPFQWERKAEDVPQEDAPDSKVSPLITGAIVFATLALIFWILVRFFPSLIGIVPVDVMVENSTQSALERAMDRSMTQTAVMRIVVAPITQTAAAIETLEHPPTPTIQFPTIVALPTEILVPGNIKMIYVPGDNFLMGDENDAGGTAPAHTLYVNPFYIDKYEVTNVLYRLCVDSGGCEPPKSLDSKTRLQYYGNVEFNEYPVVNVDWKMARQYCEWRGARLPTEAEWEKAARGLDGREYPWGNNLDCTLANFGEADSTCVGDTVSVGGYEAGRSFYGVFDMSGNVSEWVNSLYWSYPYSSRDGRENPAITGLRVVRGGGWASRAGETTTYYRFGDEPSTYDMDTGFRCARDAGQ